MSVLAAIADEADRRHVPLEVLFEVTHRCNLPCAHCYLADGAPGGELSLAEIDDLLDQLARAGTLFLTLTGGEVLSRRDFLEIVDHAAERGFAIKVLTNATLVTDEVADRFARAGVLQVSVSIYGADGTTHDAVTRQPGSFARTMRGVERLRARGLQVVFKSSLMTLNGAAASSVHELARAHGIPCRFNLAISAKNDGDPSPLDLQLAAGRLADVLSDPSMAAEIAHVDGPGPSPCGAGRAYCAISPTGDVMPCIMMPVTLGNLRAQRFEELWAGGPFLDGVRALRAEDLACASCDVKGACPRCPGMAMRRGADVTGCDPSGRIVAEARLRARARMPKERPNGLP